MASPEIDPCMVMTLTGRSLQMNNAFRVAQIAEAAVQQRRNPEGFKAFILKHLQWGEVEAVVRDRDGEDVPMLLGPVEPARHVLRGRS